MSEKIKELLKGIGVALLLFLPFIIIVGGSYLFSCPFTLDFSQTSHEGLDPFNPIGVTLGIVYIPWSMLCFSFLLREQEKTK